MQLSLVEAGVSAGAGEPPGQPPLVAVPSAVGEELQLMLGGPGAPSEAKARAWAVCTPMMCIAVLGPLFAQMLPMIDPALAPAATVNSVALAMFSLALAANTHLRWRALNAANAQQDDA